MLRAGDRLARNDVLPHPLSNRPTIRRGVRFERWLGLILWFGLVWTLLHYGGR